MKETVREDIIKTIHGSHFDLAIQNPGLNETITTFGKVLSGKKVLLTFENDITRNYSWQVLSFLPDSFADLPGKIFFHRRLREWRKLAPHLIRPLKILYPGKTPSKLLINLADLLMDNNYQKRAARVNLLEVPLLQNSKLTEGKAWLAEGYKVNAERLKTELLKEIFARGSMVLNYAPINKSGKYFLLTDIITGNLIRFETTQYLTCKQENVNLFYSGNLPWPDFAMKLDSKNREFVFYDDNDKLAILTVPETDIDSIIGLLHSEFGISLNNLQLITAPLEKTNIFRSKKPKIFAGINLLSQGQNKAERPVEDLMETAYDLAKQTGIGFREFRNLYFIYGAATGWMTDKAYDYMAKTRNVHEIWRNVEKEYVNRFEWGV